MNMFFSPCASTPVRTFARIGLLALLACAAPAQAQLGGARLNLPGLSGLPGVGRLPLQPTLDSALNAVPLQQLRLTTVRDLLRKHSDVIEADPNGEPVRRAELLLVSPTPEVVQAALALGFVLLRDDNLPELDLRQVVLRVPPGQTTARALALLRQAQPTLEVDYNHIYTASGMAEPQAQSAAAVSSGATTAAVHTPALRVGLVDGGVEAQHAALRGTAIRPWGCQDKPNPSEHGTAVASLMLVPGTALYAADVYCGQPAGGAVEDVARALAWMARERVPVVNISLVGPANRLLERSVQALLKKGHLVVAAVGNDGPAAAPLYPASYVGVVGVTGVSASQRVLPEAAQGQQVMFAALGVQRRAAQLGGGTASVRGTSFAAPRVAAVLAQQLSEPDVAAAQAAVARLAATAKDLVRPGAIPSMAGAWWTWTSPDPAGCALLQLCPTTQGIKRLRASLSCL